MISTRLAVGLARAAAKVRDGDAPAILRRMPGDGARVVAVGASLEAVEQRDAPRRSRFAGEIDVDEVAVGRVPAFALEREPRRRPQRGVNRLQVAAREPPGG